MKQHSLDILLRPRSIAFVGASDRPNSTGAAMLAMCLIDGFDGKIFLINPRLNMLNGRPCYADLKALPEVPDHVVIGVASRFVEVVVDQALELGIRAATIFASCYLMMIRAPVCPRELRLKRPLRACKFAARTAWGFTLHLRGCGWPVWHRPTACKTGELLGLRNLGQPLARYPIMTGDSVSTW